MHDWETARLFAEGTALHFAQQSAGQAVDDTGITCRASDDVLQLMDQRLLPQREVMLRFESGAAVAAAILCLVGDVAAAGAASSLIFLLVFAMCHGLCLVTRKHKPHHDGFRVPGWPWLPWIGLVASAGTGVSGETGRQPYQAVGTLPGLEVKKGP